MLKEMYGICKLVQLRRSRRYDSITFGAADHKSAEIKKLTKRVVSLTKLIFVVPGNLYFVWRKRLLRCTEFTSRKVIFFKKNTSNYVCMNIFHDARLHENLMRARDH